MPFALNLHKTGAATRVLHRLLDGNISKNTAGRR